MKPPRRCSPPLTLRRQPRRNFPLQFFFCARPLKKILKRKGKFLLGSALQVFGRCGRASFGRLGIPPPDPLLPSLPRFGERADIFIRMYNNQEIFEQFFFCLLVLFHEYQEITFHLRVFVAHKKFLLALI